MAKATKLRAPRSWIMLGFLIFVSFTIILLGREQQDLFTGRVTIQPIAYMKAGSQEFIETKGIPGLFGVTVVFSTDTKDNLLRVEENEQISFGGDSFSKFTISWKDAAAVERMEFRLKILEEELYRRGINPAELQLYVDGRELETTLTKRGERYLYYKSVSGEVGDGDYVIGKAAIEKASQPTTALPIPEKEPGPLGPEPAMEKRSPEPAPAAAEEIVQQPKISSGQRFWAWIRNLFASS